MTIFGWLGLLSGNAGAQTCSFVFSPASIYLDSTAQSATLALTASDPSCPWTAVAVGSFLSVTSAAQGTGSGTVTVGVSANTTGSDVTGSLQVGGQTLPVTQRFTTAVFTDVPASAYYFDAVNLLSAKMITSGCGTGLYCPSEDVTRAQMAIFIVRAVMGGNNFSFSPTPHFTDVPVGAFGFQWIQKMFELGITAGCGPALYCPNDSVTRAEMAVFIIRARYGSAAAFDYPPTPYFTDVPTGAFAFNYIQRMKEDNITSGCSATTYCPDDPVIRGDMAIFIMRGTFDQLLPTTEPVITQVSPSTVPAGQTTTVTINGLNTNFVQGTTTVSPIPGFTIGATTVTSPTTLQVSVTAGTVPSVQPESVWVKTNSEEAVKPNGISVIASQQPTLTSITVSPSTATVLAGGTQQFTAQGLYSDNSSQNLTAQATWTVAPSTVAAVTSAGLATGIAPGSATVSAAVGSISGTASLSVASPSSVTITGPANLTFLNTSPTTVNGTVSDPSAIINVNGIPTPNSGGAFSVSVPLLEGNNAITATAQSASGITSAATIQVTLDTTPPRATIYSPSNGTVTSDSTVTVTGIVNDTVVGTVNNQQVTLTVNGIPAQVANRSFLAPGIPLALGANTMTAVATDRAGNSYTTSISVTRNAPTTQPQIELISGTNQSATVSSQTPAPLVVALVDGSGHPVPGVSVIFKVTENNGMLSASGNPAGPLQLVTTGSNGQAQAIWTLGTHSGAASDMVQAYAVGYSGVISFSATALQSQAGMIVVDSGNTQTGAAGQALPLPFVAVVTDSGFNRLANVPVTFTVQKGGGTINGGTTYTTNSDSDGRVQAVLTLGLQEGIGNNLVTANFAGNTSFPASFTASGMVAGAAANTTVTGVVLDNSSNPLAGVTIQAVPLSQVAQAPGSVSTAPSFLTNSQGQFTVTGAPVGSIRLMVNGGTAQSPNHYPDLEYSMVTIAGQANTVGMPIYLIHLDTVNQLCVSETQGGTLTLPQSPGFSLTVLPGSVTFPGGSRQGCLSVTPVHGDKVPMVPGFGQQPRFIVTIQPTGAIFNPPTAITLPNVDGLPARSVTEMYSYDHDLASFVSIGNGTVSADGTVIASNPGVGVLKAGWHCGGNPGAIGTVADCPVCNYCAAPGQCEPDFTQVTCTSLCLTGLGLCQAGSAGALASCTGTPVNCSSGNPCIDDGCSPSSGCTHVPNQQCSQACNGASSGQCDANGVAGMCDASGNCDLCSSLPAGSACVTAGVVGKCSGGKCTNSQTSNPCEGVSNGSSCGPCYTGGTCSNGQCVGGSPITLSSVVASANGKRSLVTTVGPTVSFAATVGQQGCATPTYTWNFGDGGLSSDPAPSHFYSAPGVYAVVLTVTCGSCATATDTVQVTAATVKIVTFWSNQLQDGNGLIENYYPGGEGTSQTQLLMGADENGSASTGLTVSASPSTAEVLAAILVRYRDSADITSSPIGTSTVTAPVGSDAEVSLSAPGFGVTNVTGSSSFLIVAGLDEDGDGQLDISEVLDTTFVPVVVVPQGTYLANQLLFGGVSSLLSASCAALYLFLGLSLGVPENANCLTAETFMLTFASQIPPIAIGADPTPTTVSEHQIPGGQSLHSRVGISFDGAGNATFPQYKFSPQSALAAEVRSSSAFQQLVSCSLFRAKSQIAGPGTVTLPLGIGSITFHDSDFDLEISFGDAALTNVVFEATLALQGADLFATSATITGGDLIDIYNWDYLAPTPQNWLAELQAGYPSLGFGGKVFSEDVQLQGYLPGYSFDITASASGVCPAN